MRPLILKGDLRIIWTSHLNNGNAHSFLHSTPFDPKLAHQGLIFDSSTDIRLFYKIRQDSVI